MTGMPQTAEPGASAPVSETDAYQQSLAKVFGGRRGLIDMGVPGLLFVVLYTPTQNIALSAWTSVGLAVVFAVVRLVRRETLQHALSGVVFVAICALLSGVTHHARDYFQPGMVINAGCLLLCAASALAGYPAIGLLLGPITGENLTWRQIPGRRRAFTAATWLLAGVFVVRLVLEVPLYLANEVTALGIIRTVTSYPLYAAALYVCWQIIRKAPPPLKVADGEPERAAEIGATEPETESAAEPAEAEPR
jgi:hypothetical protein